MSTTEPEKRQKWLDAAERIETQYAGTFRALAASEATEQGTPLEQESALPWPLDQYETLASGGGELHPGIGHRNRFMLELIAEIRRLRAALAPLHESERAEEVIAALEVP